MTIYHLVTKNDWKRNVTNGVYTPPSLKTEGFIHCSTKAQVLATANRRFARDKDLLLLEIDTEKTAAEIIFEDLRGTGEKHPHIYGILPLSAVQTILPLLPNTHGVFMQFPT